ncbi:hypothetical protein C8N37_102631 [Sphingobacterium faecium]|nr:hypothetical protein C8N37_102631 [Sphingobacterium faecium]
MTIYDHTTGSYTLILLINCEHFIVKSKRTNRIKKYEDLIFDSDSLVHHYPITCKSTFH